HAGPIALAVDYRVNEPLEALRLTLAVADTVTHQRIFTAVHDCAEARPGRSYRARAWVPAGTLTPRSYSISVGLMRGHEVVGPLRRRGHGGLRSDIVQHHAPDYVQTDVVSLLDLYERARAFQAEAVYHLAAMVSRVTCEAAPHLTIDTNLAGTNNVAQLC